MDHGGRLNNPPPATLYIPSDLQALNPSDIHKIEILITKKRLITEYFEDEWLRSKIAGSWLSILQI